MGKKADDTADEKNAELERQDLYEVATPQQVQSQFKEERTFTDEELASITTFDDAMDFMAEQFGNVEDIGGVLGNGYTVLNDKQQLVGKPFVIVDARYHPNGSYGPFVTIAVITKNSERYMVNDGSTGIAEQLVQLAQTRGRTKGYMVAGGLDRSTYDICPMCNRSRPVDVDPCNVCGNESKERAEGVTYRLSQAAVE